MIAALPSCFVGNGPATNHVCSMFSDTNSQSSTRPVSLLRLTRGVYPASVWQVRENVGV